MKSKIVFAVLALGFITSCAGNPGVVTITGFSPLEKDTCKAVAGATTFQTRGVLDIANGQAPNRVEYWLQVNYKFNATIVGVAGGGKELETPDRESFALSNVHLTYSIKKGAGAVKTLPATDDVPYSSLTIANTGAAVPITVIGPKGSEALFNEVVPAPGGRPSADDIIQLIVGVEVVGRLSGTNVPVNSGKVEFPIEVYQSTTCGAGYQPVLFTCPFPGQDGTDPKCK